MANERHLVYVHMLVWSIMKLIILQFVYKFIVFSIRSLLINISEFYSSVATSCMQACLNLLQNQIVDISSEVKRLPFPLLVYFTWTQIVHYLLYLGAISYKIWLSELEQYLQSLAPLPYFSIHLIHTCRQRVHVIPINLLYLILSFSLSSKRCMHLSNISIPLIQ